MLHYIIHIHPINLKNRPISLFQLESNSHLRQVQKKMQEDGEKHDSHRRSRERSIEKDDRYRRRSRSRDRDRRRSRSGDRRRQRSNERRHRRSRSRSRSRSRDRRRRHRSRSYDRHRQPRRERERERLSKEEEELKQLERTTRTIQAYNLSLKAEERDLFEFFSKAGKIADIKIIRDKTTGRSIGFAYIEYLNKDSIVPSMSLSGQTLLGQAVMVKPSEAEKNIAWEQAQAAKRQQQLDGGAALSAQAAQASEALVLASNLHASLTEEHLRPIFEPFGELQSIMVQKDTNGISLGSAIVQYKSSVDAKSAIENLQGNINIHGMVMQLSRASGSLGAGSEDAAVKNSAAAAAAAVHTVEERLDVDATDGGGLRLTAQSRAELMSKLAAKAGIEMPTHVVAPPAGVKSAAAHGHDALALEQGLLGPASPIPTQCLLLKNMFDPAEETAPHWDEDIAMDVKDECSKFGSVEYLYVDAKSKGFVYVKMNSVEAASAAQRALHGRWFNQKQLYAEFQFVQMFNAYFKL